MATPHEPTAGAPRVLVADDDEAIRTLLARALALEGYAVRTADNGRTALEILVHASRTGKPPAAVVLDQQMPGLTGLEVLRAYHAAPGPHAPAVLFTGDPRAHELARTARVDGVIAKPGDVDELLELVGALAAGAAETLRPGGRYHQRWVGGLPACWCVWDTWEAHPTDDPPVAKRRWARRAAHTLDQRQAVADQRRLLEHTRRADRTDKQPARGRITR